MSQIRTHLASKRLSDRYDYLAPDGSEIRELLSTRGGGLAHCVLPAGAVSSAVVHRTVEELWYCLSGSGQVWRKLGTEEEVTDFRPGACLTIPVGAHFQFRSTDASSLVILIVTMPPWPGSGEATPVPGHWETKAQTGHGTDQDSDRS